MASQQQNEDEKSSPSSKINWRFSVSLVGFFRMMMTDPSFRLFKCAEEDGLCSQNLGSITGNGRNSLGRFHFLDVMMRLSDGFRFPIIVFIIIARRLGCGGLTRRLRRRRGRLTGRLRRRLARLFGRFRSRLFAGLLFGLFWHINVLVKKCGDDLVDDGVLVDVLVAVVVPDRTVMTAVAVWKGRNGAGHQEHGNGHLGRDIFI